MYTSIIFLILWLISFGMLNIAKSLWENNHKKVMVEEKFEKYLLEQCEAESPTIRERGSEPIETLRQRWKVRW